MFVGVMRSTSVGDLWPCSGSMLDTAVFLEDRRSLTIRNSTAGESSGHHRLRAYPPPKHVVLFAYVKKQCMRCTMGDIASRSLQYTAKVFDKEFARSNIRASHGLDFIHERVSHAAQFCL